MTFGGWDLDIFEAVVEWTWVIPVASTEVFTVRAAAAVKNDTKNDESYNGDDLDNGEDELGFAIALAR